MDTYGENILYVETSFSLIPDIQLDQPEISAMTKKESTKIVHFMTLRAGVLVLNVGRSHYSFNVIMHYFFENLLFYS